MIPDKNSLPDRDFDFIRDRLKWLEQEINRYRDFEWKATSFNAAFFVALLYGILNPDWQTYINTYRRWLSVAVVIYLFYSCANIIYIHMRLNGRRNEKVRLLFDQLKKPCIIPASELKPIINFWGFCEGWGVIFPIGFLLSLIALAIATLAALGLSASRLLAIILGVLIGSFFLILSWREK